MDFRRNPELAKGTDMKRLIVLFCMGMLIAASSAAMAGQQQERMKACSKEAKGEGVRGAERRAFMKECLSKKESTASDKKTGTATVGK